MLRRGPESPEGVLGKMYPQHYGGRSMDFEDATIDDPQLREAMFSGRRADPGSQEILETVEHFKFREDLQPRSEPQVQESVAKGGVIFDRSPAKPLSRRVLKLSTG